MAQIATNWVINQKGVSTAIVGARSREQLEENIKAVDIVISADNLNEMALICEDVKNDVADWDTMYYKKAEQLIIDD